MQIIATYGHLPASHWCNMDETCMMCKEGKIKVICRTGSPHSHTWGNATRESITILPFVCSDGFSLPPLIIKKGKRTPTKWSDLADTLRGTSFEGSHCCAQVSIAATHELLRGRVENADPLHSSLVHAQQQISTCITGEWIHG